MTSVVLPKGESFSSPDWSNNPASSDKIWGPWWQQYVNYQPNHDLTSGTAPDCPYLSGEPLESISTGQIYTSHLVSPLPGAMCTDVSGTSQSSQRAFLCREEDAIANDDNTYKVKFALADAGGGQLGSSVTERSGGASGVYSISFPTNDATEDVGLPTSSKDAGGTTAGLQGGTLGTLFAVARGNQGMTGLHTLWNGNSVFFRVGAGDPERITAVSANLGQSEFAVGGFDAYAFCAYPTPNASTEAVDLDLELWQIKHTTGGDSAVRLAKQTIAGGVSRIKFGQPYHLKVEVENAASSVEIKCYIGAYSTPHNGDVAEVQCFKDDEFASGTATVTAGTDVTVTTSTGIVEHTASDRIVSYIDRTFGWSMGRDRSQDVSDRTFASGQVIVQAVESVVSLEVLNTSTAGRTYYDNWTRSVPGAPVGQPGSIRTIENQFGDYGPQRLGRFTLDYDAQYTWPSNDDRQVRRSAWCNELPLDYTSYGQDHIKFLYGYDLTSPVGTDYTPDGMFRTMVDTFPQTRLYNHRRSISFKPPQDNPGALGSPPDSINSFEVGVWARGYFNAYQTNSGLGAVAYWSTDGDGSMTFFRIAIYERVWTGRNQYIAPASVGNRVASKTYLLADIASAPNIYDGAYHTLDFRVELDANASSPNSPSKYYVEFDGVPIELDDTNADLVSSTVSPYEVSDISPVYTTGEQECFTFWSLNSSVNSSGTSWNPAQFQSWQEGDVADDPDFSIDDDALASLVLAGEPTPTTYLNASGGALAFGSSFYDDVDTEIQVTSQRGVSGGNFESGHRYTYSTDANDRRRYSVSISSVSKEVIDNFSNFYSARQRAGETFFFDCDILQETTLGKESIPVFFARDSLKIEMVGPQIYNCSFVLVDSIQ
jgi:hypothetical protein